MEKSVRRSFGLAIAALLVVVLLLLGLWYFLLRPREQIVIPALSPAVPGALNLYMLDVGQGDALLLLSPGGKSLLVDTGSENTSGVLIAALRALDIKELDILLLTHCHADHAGGAAALLEKFPVKQVYLTGGESGYPPALLRQLKRQNLSPLRPWSEDTADFDAGVMVKFLSPFSDRAMGDDNDASAVVRVEYGISSLLLCADATLETENLLLSLYPLSALDCTVLKAAHHGADTATGEWFLQAADPELVLLSVGRNNGYGHPSPQLLQRLREADIPYVSTAEAGTVHLVLDGAGCRVVK